MGNLANEQVFKAYVQDLQDVGSLAHISVAEEHHVQHQKPPSMMIGETNAEPAALPLQFQERGGSFGACITRSIS